MLDCSVCCRIFLSFVTGTGPWSLIDTVPLCSHLERSLLVAVYDLSSHKSPSMYIFLCPSNCCVCLCVVRMQSLASYMHHFDGTGGSAEPFDKLVLLPAEWTHVSGFSLRPVL